MRRKKIYLLVLCVNVSGLIIIFAFNGQNSFKLLIPIPTENSTQSLHSRKPRDEESIGKGSLIENTIVSKAAEIKPSPAASPCHCPNATSLPSPPAPHLQRKNEPDYKFQEYDVERPGLFHLQEDTTDYFQTVFNVTCFLDGTDWQATLTTLSTEASKSRCYCLKGWHGEDCGIPASVWPAIEFYQLLDRLKRRTKPRRVINAINVNHELDMLATRVHELGNSVDVYLIGESNFTAYGTKKPLLFYNRFREGFLKEFQSKFVYVYQNVFPSGGREDGWIADGYQRTFLSKQGLKQLQGLRDDDIFLLNDADELPKREVVTFLKLYDNYYENIRLKLIWTVFGFYWLPEASSTEVAAACTIRVLMNDFRGDALTLRRGSSTGSSWVIGGPKILAGWHCSWCFVNPKDIRTKLTSAQNGDKPRWGDYPEKTELNYIRKLIRTGLWFDDMTHFTFRTVEDDYAPNFFLWNAHRFHALLFRPSDSEVPTTVVVPKGNVTVPRPLPSIRIKTKEV